MRPLSKTIKIAMVDKGVKPRHLAEDIGVSPRTISVMLTRDSLSFKTASMYADALGCDIVLQDRETGKIY